MSETMALTLSTGSLESYISSAFKIPMLTAKQERDYAMQLRDHDDLDAAKSLVLPHLRFVVRVARGYSGYGLQQQDLIQEGTVGLMKAVRRFDPDRGVRLVSFAVHWIRAEIHEFILRNWRIVKVATTKAQRKLFFNLRSKKKHLGWFSQQEVNEVAEDLGVKPETVLEMESRLYGSDLSWDLPPGTDDEEQSVSPGSWLPDDSAEPAKLVEQQDANDLQHQQLLSALEQLDERSRSILQARWLSDSKSTLQDLATEYGVSAERIRQIEKSAMNKIRTQMVS
ncbi:MAG TPA: RNA polymerase sigma factor RpoH [Gammaproteobacteria bacterium]|nr:RNA polymerase sigma factor RpoH [Gammaproteobacteria bacterium]